MAELFMQRRAADVPISSLERDCKRNLPQSFAPPNSLPRPRPSPG